MNKASIDDKTEKFFSHFPPVSFKKGKTILPSGTNPSGLYYLKKGFVRQYIFSENGNELTIHFFKPGSFFPLFWVINNLPNKYYYEAFTAVEVNIAPKEQTLEFLRSDPELLFKLSSRLLFGLEGLVTRIESLASADARERTIGIILFLGKHFGNKGDNKLSLTSPFTHEDIAKLTGLTRETTSRELENLAKENLITTKNHLISVPNLSNLQ